MDDMVDDIIITRNKQRRETMRDDLISRREVMDSLTNEYNRRFMAGDRGGLKMAWIEKAVDDVPPARRCSICGEYMWHSDDQWFCPNCGVDMRGKPRLHITESEEDEDGHGN